MVINKHNQFCVEYI